MRFRLWGLEGYKHGEVRLSFDGVHGHSAASQAARASASICSLGVQSRGLGNPSHTHCL